MKYFSMFSGIGGFEHGIEKARRFKHYSSKENTQHSKRDKSISEGKESIEQSYNKLYFRIPTSTKNPSGALLQDRQEQSNSNTKGMGSIENNIESRKQMGERSNTVLREGDGIRDDKESLLGQRDSSNLRSYECIGFSEIDKYSIQTYSKHFPNHKNYGNAKDINPEELPDFDILCGGFPCQSFSIAGNRMGFEDTRGTLFFEIARIVKVKRPQLLFLENVKGLLNHDNGRTFTTIIATLDELGYNAEWQVLNSKHFGVPQNRERVFIIGHLRGQSSRQIFPLREGSRKIQGGMEKKVNIIGTTKSETAKGTNSRSWVHNTEGIIGALDSTQYKQPKQIITHNLQQRSADRPSIQENKNAGGSGHLMKDDGTSYSLDSGNTQAIEMRGGLQDNAAVMINESPALTEAMGKGGGHTPIVNRIRRLTPVECERLQGFPDGWTEGVSDTQRYKQLGNAVTVNVIQAIAEKLLGGNKNETNKNQ